MKSKIGIIGTGAWGSALSVSLSHGKHEVWLICRDEARARDMNKTRRNHKRLPNIELPPQLHISADIKDALACDIILLAIPLAHFEETVQHLAGASMKNKICVICCKGMLSSQDIFPYEYMRDKIPEAHHYVLSGPNLADEIARLLPSAAVIAGSDTSSALRVAQLLGHRLFRLYGSDDAMGCSLGGAVKNVFAIGAGAIIGHGLGENARAAFITRGQAEMMNLADALKAKKETLSGLAGFGDLCLTASSQKSRNMRLGIMLGQKIPLEDALEKVGGVCEGFHSVRALLRRAQKVKIATPLVKAIAALLHEGSSMEKEIDTLLARPFTTE